MSNTKSTEIDESKDQLEREPLCPTRTPAAIQQTPDHVDDSENLEEITEQQDRLNPQQLVGKPINTDTNVHREKTASRVTFKSNVLILGKVAMGKATIANKIAGNDTLFPILSSVHSMARQPRERNETVSVQMGDGVYNLTFLLFDTRGPKGKMQTDLRKSCEESFGPGSDGAGVNLILLVLNESKLTNEDIDLMKDVIKSVQKEVASGICALVVTGCEQKSKKERDDYRRQLCESEKTKAIASFVKKGIYLVGFPDKSRTDSSLMETFKDAMEEDAQVLRDLVTKCNAPKFIGEVLVANKKSWMSYLMGGSGSGFSSQWHEPHQSEDDEV